MKALFVGINYFGTAAELRGCINDVKAMQSLLSELYGWPTDENSMRALTDDGGVGIMRGTTFSGPPTKRNIMVQMQWLIHGARPGDVLFFHFSGHGSQEVDPNGWEEDGMNETILPVDFENAGMISDDVISGTLCCSLPDGCRLIALMDSCHSGTGLDLPFHMSRASNYGNRFTEVTNPLHTL